MYLLFFFQIGPFLVYIAHKKRYIGYATLFVLGVSSIAYLAFMVGTIYIYFIVFRYIDIC
jgi:hypothetical protein